MKLIVGLGNPGSKFRNTRHNLGFVVVDAFVKNMGLSWRYNPDWIGYFAKNQGFVVIKPTTFMNKSGEAVRLAAHFFKVETRNILVVHDDLDLEFGKLRISFDSSGAGHKGVESVIESLATFEFARVRIGIGQSPALASGGKRVDAEKYVLEEFSRDEQKELSAVIERATEAVKSYIEAEIEATMNLFN